MHGPQGILSPSWCQKVSPTQGVDKERRESVRSTVGRGKERIEEGKVVSETHGHNSSCLISVVKVVPEMLHMVFGIGRVALSGVGLG